MATTGAAATIVGAGATAEPDAPTRAATALAGAPTTAAAVAARDYLAGGGFRASSPRNSFAGDGSGGRGPGENGAPGDRGGGRGGQAPPPRIGPPGGGGAGRPPPPTTPPPPAAKSPASTARA